MPEASQFAVPALVIAGAGYVGERLARAHPALCLARSAARAAQLQAAGLPCAVFDFDTGRIEPALRARIDGAALIYLAPPPGQGTSDPRLAGFLATLAPAAPRVLVYMSTTGVYGDAGGAEVSAATPVAPGTERARRRVAAENTAREWCTAHGLRCVILRVPGIYGPGRLPLERLRSGDPVLREDQAGPGNRIHVDDLVAACIAAVTREVEGVFNVGDGDHASATQFLCTLARLAGVPAPPQISLEDAQRVLSPERLSFLAESRRVDTGPMRAQLGVALRYPDHEAGLRAALAETQNTELGVVPA